MTRLTEPAEVAIATASADAAPQPSFVSNYRVLFFLLPAAIVIFNRVYIPGIHYDFLNVIPAAASLGLAYVVTRSKTATGQGRAAKTERWFRRLLFWRWVRGLLLVLLLFVAAEFGLRCFSYHRAMQYEQQEDLSFTPVPDQQYVEKIPLTGSQP